MPRRPPEPEPERAPDHATIEPSDDADWDEERMRRAKPREIRLNPEGTRQDTGGKPER